MKPAAFEYVRAASLAEALAALDHDDAKIIAGGQSLVPMMNFRLAQPARLVDINAIPDLNRIEDAGAHVVIGALVRHAQAMGSDLLAARFPVVAEAMAHVAHLAIRNRGSIGGSLAHADPSAEWPLVVALLDGEIVVAGPDGERTAAAEDFFVAPLVTDLAEDEIVVAVRLPVPPARCGMAFDEMSRRAGDFAILDDATAIAAVRAHVGLAAIDVRRARHGGIDDTGFTDLVGEPEMTVQESVLVTIVGKNDFGLPPRNRLKPEIEIEMVHPDAGECGELGRDVQCIHEIAVLRFNGVE